ncbi:hypothetical protein WA158_002304 [Blastocystis sp. Blastoise]
MKGYVIALFLLCVSAYDVMSLNGDWNINNKNETIKIVGKVPGLVHTALMSSGILEDPYYRDNDYKYQWVGKDYWTYSRDFEVNWDYSDKDTYIYAKGIDTIADVYVNEKLVGHAENMYRRYWFNINDAIQSGKNTITVRFNNAYYWAQEQKDKYPYDVHEETSYAPFKDGHRAFTRKTQSDFGWDWGPSFVPTGIFRDIEVVSIKKAYIRDISVQMFKIEKEGQETMWQVKADVILQCKKGAQGSIDLSLETGLKATGNYYCEFGTETIVQIILDVPQNTIDLWYPIGYGKPTLYTLTASSDDTTKSVKIGFRTVQLVTDPLDGGEETFYFKVNDIPVFIKGSNFIPMDAFDDRITDDLMKRIIDGAVMGNHNSIRIWGGGLYQRDSFYDYCDEKGVLIWQEFMFACNLYPRHKQFLENVREEIIDTIHRLSHHSCIFLWSGNNENQNPAQQSTQTLLDYVQLYDETIRRTLQTIDISRPYWPASPSNGYIIQDLEQDLFIQRWGSEGDQKYGDMHRYDYGSLCTDVHTYPHPKFTSEFGFHSLPSYYTWRPVIEEEDMSITSDIIKLRNHHMDGNSQVTRMMSNFFPTPKGSNKVDEFRNNILQSQIMQGYCIDYQAEHYRRSRTEYHTMGTMYWQLNDIWQAPTWASLEFNTTRWKALHYMMKETYANVLASVYSDGDSMKIYYINDELDKFVNATVDIYVYTWAGEMVKKDSISFDMEPLAANKVFEKNIEEFIAPNKRNEVIIKYVLHYNNIDTIPRYYMPNINNGLFKNIQLQDPKIKIYDIKPISNTEVEFKISSESVGAHVWLECEVPGVYSDNAFMLIPKEDKTIHFTSFEPMTEEQQKLVHDVRSIWNTYN